MAELKFNVSPEPTIGVELELQLLDAETLESKNVAPDVLKTMDPVFTGRIKEEFIRSMIEVNTRICKDMREVDEDLRATLAYLEEHLKRLGLVFYSASLHPFSRGTAQDVTDNPRYVNIMDDLQLVGRRFIAQGIHVHIGVNSPERAIQINNTIRMHLPLLLALSTSSPFYMGEETGLYSYRTKLFEALPLAGLPDSLESWEEFCRLAELLRTGGIIQSVKDLWWDVRPHPDFGTIEVRICDIPCRYAEILALTAFIQALVVTLSNVHLHPETRVQMQILRANKWQAARYGLDGIFVNPVTARRVTMRDAVRTLVEFVEPKARELGALDFMEELEVILANGTGAHTQQRIYGEEKYFRPMIGRVRELFYT